MKQNKQNKGIGAYRDRPGYFMGGMIGGAILGALVNKIQGKDWKKGAMWGGITGGLGSAFMGPSSSAWISKMNPGIMKSLATWGATNPAAAGAVIGGGAGYLAGDPEGDERKIREEKERRLREQMARNRQFYPNWYTNPWTGDEMRNTGGMINARKRYYNGGGSATLEYTDPDLYTPTGEGGGPSSNPILQIPLGPEGSFADEFEDLDLASGPSGSDMSGWYEMYEDLKGKGELPDWMDSFEIFMQNLDVLDISPWDFSARGGYKTRPQYRDAGAVNKILPQSPSFQEWLDEYDNEEEAYEAYINYQKMLSERHKGHPMGSRQDDLYDQLQQQLAYRAEGGIADLDMTGGGASFGPGTGTSDDIPAMLSDGEFVVTANAVQNLGGGDRMLGARRMYQMMNQLDPNSQTPAEMNTVGYA